VFIETINNFTIHRINEKISDLKGILEDKLIDEIIGESLLDQLENIKKQASTKSILLRMSKGSGWDFMTGAWIKDKANESDWEVIKKTLRQDKFDKYKGYGFPKSEIITKKNGEFILPSFVKLTFE
jgi:hypothetical protein